MKLVLQFLKARGSLPVLRHRPGALTFHLLPCLSGKDDRSPDDAGIIPPSALHLVRAARATLLHDRLIAASPLL
jgi:hypothetical protein